MKTCSRFAAFLCLFILAGCATPPSGDTENSPTSVYRASPWELQADALDISDEIKTARVNEFVFRQEFFPVEQAVLQEDVDLYAPAGSIFQKPKGPVTFAAGRKLNRVRLPEDDLVVFCDPTTSWEEDTMFGRQSVRFCLVDTDKDQIFDQKMNKAMNVFNVDSFTNFPIAVSKDDTVSVPYELTSEHEAPVMTAGLVLTRGLKGALRLEFAVRSNGPNGHRILQGAAKSSGEASSSIYAGTFYAEDIFVEREELPIVVSTGGASVEILSAEGKEITYRVLNGFDPAETYNISYNGTLPIWLRPSNR